uniref:Histone deacetylase domain-containing protein n=1 Tax=Geoglobus ahangari TaxID=113653 RepID=A0A7C3YNY5_9EURY
MTIGVFFHREFIGKNWPIVGDRYAGFKRILEELSKDPEITVIEPEPVSEELLLRVHTKEFLEEQKRAWYYHGAKLTVGGLVRACEMVWKGELRNAVVFLVAAGHHASRSSAWGGTYLSCIGPALIRLRELGLRKLALIDTDAHHGDGDRNVLHICFCWRSDIEDEGTKICVNVRDTEGDEYYLEKVRETFPIIRDFKPEMIVHFLGHDTHRNDYGSLGLSEDFYVELAREVKELAEEVCDRRYVIMDGGGANREVGEYIWPRIINVLKKCADIVCLFRSFR